ncbi:MAG: protein-glutamate O-methyltransferase CheR [Candidatus Omnitrophota bacterium]
MKLADYPKGLDSFITFINKRKGMNLELYRRSFLSRRLKVRMDTCGTKDLLEYTNIIQRDHLEWDRFKDALSINVSEFFRDREVFDFFHKHCLKRMIEDKKAKGQRTIRLWSAGCSCGEEAYSLAILLKESLGEKDQSDFLYHVYGTDVDLDALDKAKKGEFAKGSLKNVDQIILNKYFNRISENSWQVNSEIKKIVFFQQHNLMDPPPIKWVDIVFCRNVRIYFSNTDAEKVVCNINDVLRDKGYIVLGKVEILPVCLKKGLHDVKGYHKIFQKHNDK